MDIKKINEFLESKKGKRISLAVVCIIVALLVFQMGIVVGYQKASFAFRFGDSYYREFGMGHHGMMGDFRDEFFNRGIPGGHGVAGKIIKITPPTIIIEGSDNVERIILLNDQTIIRRYRDSVKVLDIKLDENAIILGTPNENGVIVAKLIRLLPSSVSSSAIASTTKTQ